MKNTIISTVVMLFALASCNLADKSNSSQKDSQTELSNFSEVLKSIDDQIYKSFIAECKADNLGNVIREENDSTIIFRCDSLLMHSVTQIYKRDYFDSDINNDGLNDLMICVDDIATAYAYSINYYLYLNENGIFKFVDIYNFSSNDSLSKHNNHDNFYADIKNCIVDSISGNMVYTRASYYGPEDPNCCPTYYSIDKYKFDNVKKSLN